jgi:hypothetical protein
VLLKEKGFTQWADTYCAEVSQGNALFIRSGRNGMPLLALAGLIFAYPWFAAKVLYRNIKNA